MSPLLLPTLFLLSSSLAAEPGLRAIGVSADVGQTRATDALRPSTSTSSELFVQTALSERLEVELSYALGKREGHGVTHELGLGASFAASDTVGLYASLWASPSGGGDPDLYCLPLPQVRCVRAEERLRFLAPELQVSVSTDPEAVTVGTLELSAGATFYGLDYRDPAREQTLLSVPLQEYRFGVDGSVDFDERLEVGLGAAVTLFHGALPSAAREVGSVREAPTELPLAPPRFEVGPTLAWSPIAPLRVRLRAEYAPYQDDCLGHSQLASLRLTAKPGRVRIFVEGALQRDVSPTDAGTLARCGLRTPDPDYVSTRVRTGFELGF